MLRNSVVFMSTALRSTATPFANLALEMAKLRLEHKNLLEDDPFGKLDAAKKLQADFAAALERMRPLYTSAAALEVGRYYSHQLFMAMRHFGYQDDPLMRQLEVQVGKLSLKRQHNSMMSTAVSPGARMALAAQSASPTSYAPNEWPQPREDFSQVNSEQMRVLDKYRGHWILQDPDIAITKRDRRIDPW